MPGKSLFQAKDTELNTYMKNQRQSLKEFEKVNEYSDLDEDSMEEYMVRKNSLDDDKKHESGVEPSWAANMAKLLGKPTL